MKTNRYQVLSAGEKIRMYRLAQNLTQEGLAEKVGISSKYLSPIENDQCEASIHVYRCIAETLGIPMWRLFCDIPEEELCILAHFDDCTEMEIRMLELLIAGNKNALRLNRSPDLKLETGKDSH